VTRSGRWSCGASAWAVRGERRGVSWAERRDLGRGGELAGPGERRCWLGRLGLDGGGSGPLRVGLVLGCCWVLGLVLFYFLSLSFPNYTQTKLNSNSNLNSTLALNQIKEMLQHDATTKIKPMINFNYLRNKNLD